MQLTITLATRAVDKLLAQLPRKDLSCAAARALNKTAVSAKAVAIKTLATQIGITQRQVRPSLFLHKANPGQLTAVLGVLSAKPLPLLALDPKAKQTPSGVSTRGPGGVRRTIPGAFIATMPTGHRGIFMRRGKARLPLRELTGPSISKVFLETKVQQAVAKTVEERWPIVLAQEINYYMHIRQRS